MFEDSLTKRELTELNNLKRKSRKYGVKFKKIKGTSNVDFGEGVYAQLGTGKATMIMKAKITVKKNRLRTKRANKKK